jgi:molecular chaperone DnaK (HSP70)
MRVQRLETTDIFKSAVFLCHGGRLAGMRIKERSQGIVSFLIEGDGILEVDLNFRNGTAQVNALKLRQSLNHLRDVLFTRLREDKGRDDDRKRDDYSRQKRRRS